MRQLIACTNLRDSRQRHFTFKQRTPPPVSNSREQENYFVLKEPHPKEIDPSCNDHRAARRFHTVLRSGRTRRRRAAKVPVETKDRSSPRSSDNAGLCREVS